MNTWDLVLIFCLSFFTLLSMHTHLKFKGMLKNLNKYVYKNYVGIVGLSFETKEMVENNIEVLIKQNEKEIIKNISETIKRDFNKKPEFGNENAYTRLIDRTVDSISYDIQDEAKAKIIKDSLPEILSKIDTQAIANATVLAATGQILGMNQNKENNQAMLVRSTTYDE